MAVLVATLMAFGKLSAQNEITAMKASGVSLYRMMAPVVAASLLVTVLVLQFNNNILPEANHRFKVLMIDIRRTKPTLSIEPGLFSQDIQGYSIIARKTFENSNDLEGVTIYDYTDPATNVVVTAEKGRVSFSADYRKLIMDLSDGEIHQVDTRDRKLYRRMRYIRHRIVMNAEGFDFERSSDNAFDRGDRELSARAMLAFVDSLRAANREAAARALVVYPPAMGGLIADPRALQPTWRQGTLHQAAIAKALSGVRNLQAHINGQSAIIDYNARRINEYLVEIHKKYAIPAACFVFVFIGAPLGIIARRGTFGVASTLSLGFFVIYWASLIGGEKLADRGYISPWFGMWMANMFFILVGLYLTLRMGKETPTINWGFLRRLVPKALRAPDPDEAA
jgi:lipopolysaccharide export system permease protein